MIKDFLQAAGIHAGRYPLMEPQDFGKLAYQSEFGPGHMISDRQRAEAFLLKEWKELPENSAPRLPEPVDESLYRFPLSVCRTADEAKLLLKLFIHTAEEHKGTPEGLEGKLKQLTDMHITGMEEWSAEWKREGYPQVHHSGGYRQAYRPHYRLVRKEYGDYFSVLTEILKMMQRGAPAVISIDGRCGSGKTWLAALIERLFPCNVFHMDDFYMPFPQRAKNWTELPGGNMDLERFRTEVLEPVRAGKQVEYRPYDCKRDRMKETRQMPFCNLTVVEGSYSRHPALAAEYDLTIFLTCGREEQRKRLQMREGGNFTAFEELWIPMEENYLEHYSIEAGSRIVADTGND